MELHKKNRGFGHIWYNYWFRPTPLFNLAICRIIIVTFQLLYLIRRNYLNHLIEQSAMPDALYQPLSVLKLLLLPFGVNYRPPLLFLEIVFWVTMVTGIFALIGLKTKPSLLIFAVGNLFIQAYLYSFGDFHHPQAIMLITLLLLALSPAGGVLSWDDLQHRISRNLRRQKFTDFDILAKTSNFARWPLLTIQWLFALIYLSAAIWKLGGSGPGIGSVSFDWSNGYTLQYYLIQDGLRWGSDLGLWLGQNHTLALISSWLAIWFETTFFLVLIFPRLAWFYLPVGAAFHTGIYLTQRAPFFQYIAIYSVFIPWVLGIKMLSRRRKTSPTKAKPEIFYDGLCPVCIRSMTVLCYFDWWQKLNYSDLEERWQYLAQLHPEVSLQDCQEQMHLLLPNGAIRKGFFAFREILRYVPPLWFLLPVMYLPGAATVGQKIYKFVASRRKRFQKCTFESCSINLSQK